MTAPLRLIFMGTPDFAVASLNALLEGPDEVVAVVSQPDRPKGRGKKLGPPPVKTLAEAHGIPVLQPLKIRTEAFRDELLAFRPDLVVVAAYGRILPPSLSSSPRWGQSTSMARCCPGIAVRRRYSGRSSTATGKWE